MKGLQILDAIAEQELSPAQRETTTKLRADAERQRAEGVLELMD